MPWRAWFQVNYVVLILFFFVLLSFTVTVWIMHENKIPDEYAKWTQGFTEGLLTGLTLAMKAPSAPSMHPPEEKSVESVTTSVTKSVPATVPDPQKT